MVVFMIVRRSIRLSVLVGIGMIGFHAMADSNPIPGFVPGQYTLEEGLEKLCGDGDNFYISKDGKFLMLGGGKYGFETSPSSEVSKSGLPHENGCNSEAKTTISKSTNETKVTLAMTLRCQDMVRKIDTNQATINKKKIVFDQSQWVNPEYHEGVPGNPHRCVWRLKSKK